MRSMFWARWATCALAITVVVPVALADRKSKSLSDCTSFVQEDKDDDKVSFKIQNTCSIPVDCAVSWRVVCAPDSKKRRSSHPGSAKLSLSSGATEATEASAAVCGDDTYAIDQISWSCQRNKD
ncbi:MAG: hypothetical protein WKG01_36430 [Kofleriaceae bacterium]